MTPHPAALEAYNRANFDPPTPELELEPAEMMQVNDESKPVTFTRAFWTIAAIASVLAVAHPFWVAAGMPVPEFLR